MPFGEPGGNFDASGGYAGTGNFNQGGGGYQGGGGMSNSYGGVGGTNGLGGMSGLGRNYQPGGGSGTVGGGNNSNIGTNIAPRTTAVRRVVNPVTGQVQVVYEPGGGAPNPMGTPGVTGWGPGSFSGSLADMYGPGYDRIPGGGTPPGVTGQPGLGIGSEVLNRSSSLAPMNMMSTMQAIASDPTHPIHDPNHPIHQMINQSPELSAWRNAIMAWRAQRPDRPQWAKGDTAARDAWRQQIMDWRQLRPDRADYFNQQPQVNPGPVPQLPPSRTPPIMDPRQRPMPRPMPPIRPGGPIQTAQVSRPVVRPIAPNLMRRNAVA